MDLIGIPRRLMVDDKGLDRFPSEDAAENGLTLKKRKPWRILAMKNMLLSLVAGIVLFVWGFVSWVVLPWHMAVANRFTDEAAVSRVLKENSPQAGVYYLPFSEKDHGPNMVGAFANVLPQGTEMNMNRQMAVGVVTQVLSAFLVLGLLGMRSGLSYWGKVGFFALAGLTIGFVSHAPYWNWFGFPAPYVGVTIADGVIGWTLAGLAVAKFAAAR
jgi:hypothetical protein